MMYYNQRGISLNCYYLFNGLNMKYLQSFEYNNVSANVNLICFPALWEVNWVDNVKDAMSTLTTVTLTKSTVLVLVLKYRPWFKQSHDGFKAWPFTIVLWVCSFHLNWSWLQWKKLSNNLGWLICQYFFWAWFKDQILMFVQWYMYVTQRLGSVCSICKALKSIVEACELHVSLLRRFYSYVGYKLRVHHFQDWWISTFYTWSFQHELSLYL